MENTLLQNELQDICSYRQIILKSNQKIQHQLLRRKNPIQLVEFCDCSNEKIEEDSLIKCAYDDKTTDYFSETDYPYSQNIIEPLSNFRDPFIADYLNQYEQNNFDSMLQPLRQRRDIQNRSQNYMTPVSSRKKVPLKHVNVSQFQNIHLPFKQSIVKRPLNQKQFLNQTLNLKKIVYDEPTQKRSYVQPLKFSKKINLTNFPQNIRVLQSERKNLRTCQKQDRPLTSRKESKSIIRNLSNNKKTSKKDVHKKFQNTDLNEISLRIKKRIQLSLVVNKSTEDSYLAVYKKQRRQREEIIDKILSQHKENEKGQKRAASNRK